MSHNFFVEHHGAELRVVRSESIDFVAHLHSQIELVYSLGGEGSMTIEDQVHTLRPGEAALCWPNRVHSYAALPEGSSYLLAIFDTALLGEAGAAFARLDCASPFLDATRVHPDVPLALRRMCEECDMSMPLRRADAAVATGRLLDALDTMPRLRADDPDALHRVLGYIQAHLSEDISLDVLAKALFLNKYYISKLFSEHVGCNLHAYLNALRINRAQGLLHDPALSLSEVISRCGYESERTFYRAFRERTGTTPRQFREVISR